jgi:hypothetical protein
MILKENCSVAIQKVYVIDTDDLISNSQHRNGKLPLKSKKGYL